MSFAACRNELGPSCMKRGLFMWVKNRAESASWK